MVNDILIVIKRNDSTTASRKHITSLVKRKLKLDRAILKRVGITGRTNKKVTHSLPVFEYTVPCPKGHPVPVIAQDNPEQDAHSQSKIERIK